MTIPKRYEITDEQWTRIEDLFPPYRTGRPAKLSNRQAFNGVLWLIKTTRKTGGFDCITITLVLEG